MLFGVDVVALPVGAAAPPAVEVLALFVRVGEATIAFGVSVALLTVCIVVASAAGLAVIEGDLLGEAVRLLTV